LGRVFDEKSTCDGGVCVEAYFKLVKEGEQVFLDVSRYGVIISLEDGGENRASSELDVINFLDIRGFEVRETELSGREVSIC
jgi:hypothetical protein